ncbi:MAG: Gldg family protein [Deltaproteobacteria bacterium]|nr:Gldg family protein [Deltaproteobacteria bacterium]
MRRLATGANAVLVTGITVVIVVLLVDLAAAVGLTWDLSSSGAALEPETLALLDALDDAGEPVTLTAFSAQRRDEHAWYRDRAVQDLLRDLDEAARLLHTAFVDFDAERVTAEAMGVRGHGTVVVQGRGRRVDLAERELFPAGLSEAEVFLGEAEIRRAIRLVLSERPRNIYLLQGHGERRVDGIRGLLALLRGQGWQVRTLDLLRDTTGRHPPEVPGDVDVIAIIGPTSPFTPDEEEVLRSWMGGGGRMAFLVDPGGFVPGVVEDLGVNVLSGVVRDRVTLFPFEDRPLLSTRRHLVTEALVDGGQATVVARAAALEVSEEVDAAVLLETSPRGWLVGGEGAAMEGRGPLAVAVAVMRPGHTARLVAVGDVDWVTDPLLDEGPGNATLAVGVFRWLLGDEGASAPVSSPEALRRVAMSATQLGAVRALLVGVLPVTTLLIGLLVWVRRRRR